MNKEMTTLRTVALGAIMVVVLLLAVWLLPPMARAGAEEAGYVGNRLERKCTAHVFEELDFVVFVDADGEGFRWDGISKLDVVNAETRIIVFDDFGTTDFHDDVIMEIKSAERIV